MWSCKVHSERGNHLSHKTQLCSFEFTHLLECFWSRLPWKWCTTSSAQSYPTCIGTYESMVPKNSSVQENPYLVEFYLVPVWAAISFFRSPIVSSSLHLIRTWGSFYMICLHFPITSELRKGFTLYLPLLSIHLLSQPVIAGDLDHVGAKKSLKNIRSSAIFATRWNVFKLLSHSILVQR